MTPADTRVLVDWLYVAVFAIIGVILALVPLAVVWILAPQQALPQKRITYESGVIPFGEAWAQFNVRYYLFALAFVVFDVEVIYIYPWAVVFKTLGSPAFYEMLTFIAVLLVGLLYAWRKGALEWA